MNRVAVMLLSVLAAFMAHWPASMLASEPTFRPHETKPGTSAASGNWARVFDVWDYGATGDGITSDTRAIQAAIDACARAGGGTVCLSHGTFLSRTLHLRSHVTLRITAGAVLLGSTDVPQYAERALLYAEDTEQTSIVGRGTIDHQCRRIGADDYETIRQKRPQIIHFQNCRNVLVRHLTLKDSITWVQIYSQCDGVVIDGITVDSRMNKDLDKSRFEDSYWRGRNQDGLTIEDSRNVRISNCHINSGDDALVFKSERKEGICKNITVANCVISSNASAIKFGTRSAGGFENVAITNCVIHDTRITGIALESVDGGTFDRVVISNIVMENVRSTALFIRLGNRARSTPPVGSLRNVTISNVQGVGIGRYDPSWSSVARPLNYSTKWDAIMARCSIGCSITGLPGFPVENITLDNVRLEFAGGGRCEDAFRAVPELPDSYPISYMFETLPAYGFYIRHARNITFKNVDIGFEHPDERPAFIFEDVENLDLFGIGAQCGPKTLGLFWLKQVKGALIHGCHLRRKVTTFVRLDGDLTEGITLTGNHPRRAEKAVDCGPDVRDDAVDMGTDRRPGIDSRANAGRRAQGNP